MDSSSNEKHEVQVANNTDIEIKDFDSDKNKYQTNGNDKKIKRGLMSYVLVGLICSIVGGTVSTAASLYYLPKSNFFKSTPLYQSIKQQNGSSSNFINASPVSANSSLTVAQIAKKVGPAVVGISTKSIAQNDIGLSQNQEGMGSGIIINEQGYILTNYHVINGAQEVNVIFNDKKEVSAKVINYDSNMDLAIIKVTDSVKMPAVAELGSSDVIQVGDPVVAIGNPMGKELLGSVTTGIISAKNREIQESAGSTSKQTFLQTDAAINPGNSGGALLNSLGQVIGVNTAKLGGNGVEGLGFAIPMDSIKPKIDSLLKPILKIGISGKDITSDLAKQNNVPEGVYVAQVQKSSAAEKSGLKVGDIITKFDGKSIKSINEINTIKAAHKSGDEVIIEITRDDKNNSLKLKLSE